MQNGQICLDVTEDTVKHYIDDNIVSAFLIINEINKDEFNGNV